MPDLYAKLGVEPSVSAAELKKAYRRLTQQYHPDKNLGNTAAEERFKEISVAWDVLGDPMRRRNYDEFGDASLAHDFNAGLARAERAHAQFMQGFSLDDLLSRFSRTERTERVQRGADIHEITEVPFMVALRGGTVHVGSHRQHTMRVPRGTMDGAKLRLRGHGQPGYPPGDLIVTIIVPAHQSLHIGPIPPLSSPRRWPDLYMQVRVTWLEMYRLGAVTIPTPWGYHVLAVDPRQEGYKLDALENVTIERQGFRCPCSPPCDCIPGNLVVSIIPKAPDPGDQELKRVLMRLQESEDPRVELARSMA